MKNSNDTITQILQKSGAILDGHFELTSGLHSSKYLEKFKLLQFPNFTEHFCKMIASHFKDSGTQVVAGPALGGVVLAFEVARLLGVRAIYAERVGNGRGFRRGLSVSNGERVLIVDDILTTGGSVEDVMKAVKDEGGNVLGVGVLIDRSARSIDLGAALYSCHSMEIPTFSSNECPKCHEGSPLTRPGGRL